MKASNVPIGHKVKFLGLVFKCLSHERGFTTFIGPKSQIIVSNDTEVFNIHEQQTLF